MRILINIVMFWKIVWAGYESIREPLKSLDDLVWKYFLVFYSTIQTFFNLFHETSFKLASIPCTTFIEYICTELMFMVLVGLVLSKKT